MIYDNIKRLAREKGVTIKQMETELSLAERHSCKWNSVAPRADTLKRVADYFGVTVDELLVEE